MSRLPVIAGESLVCPPLVLVKTLWWRAKQTLHALRSPRQVQHIQHYLIEWVDEKRVWVFAPGLSWQKQLFQRPQQLNLLK